MDGVIADFVTHFQNRVGLNSTSHDDYHQNKRQIVGTDFYATIPKFGNTDWIVKKVVDLFGGYSICTTPMQEDIDNSTRQKLVWIAENLPIMPTQVIFAKDKFLYADADTLLVDDHIRNTSKFIDAGGMAITFDNHIHSANGLIELLQRFKQEGY